MRHFAFRGGYGAICAVVGLVFWVTQAHAVGADEAFGETRAGDEGTTRQVAQAADARADNAPPADDWSPADFATREYAREVWGRDRVTGDWGGLLTDLHDHGIRPQIVFSQYLQAVATGGRDTGAEYGGKVDWILDVDVSKFVGLWPALLFNLHAETRYGDSIQPEAGVSTLPNSAMLLPLPDPYNGTDVTGLTLTQGLWEGKLPISEDKAAAVATIGKFNLLDVLNSVFPNFGYGREGFLNTNAVFNTWSHLRYVYPSMYGAGAFLLNEDAGLAQAGFLAFGQDNVSTSWDINDSFSDGVGLLGFARAFWQLADLQGYAMLIASGSTKRYGDLEFQPIEPGLPPALPNVERDRPWNITPALYQDFWQDSANKKRKAYILLMGSVADKGPSFTRWSFLGTIEAIGPLASRPADRAGFAGWFTEYNDSFKDELRLAGALLGGFQPRDIYGFELYYNVAINRWLHLTADLQLLQNLTKGDDLAVGPGARLVMDF